MKRQSLVTLLTFPRKEKAIVSWGKWRSIYRKMSKLVEKKGIPVYDDLRTWVAAASALANGVLPEVDNI